MGRSTGVSWAAPIFSLFGTISAACCTIRNMLSKQRALSHRLFDVGLSRGSSNIPHFNFIFGAKRPIACLQLRARLPSPWIQWSQSSLLRPHSHGAAQRHNFAPQRSRLFRAPKFAPDARRNRLRDLVQRVCTVSLYSSLQGVSTIVYEYVQTRDAVASGALSVQVLA